MLKQTKRRVKVQIIDRWFVAAAQRKYHPDGARAEFGDVFLV